MSVMANWPNRLLATALLITTTSSYAGTRNGVLTPPDQVVTEGATLRLNCTLTSYRGPLSASFLYIEHYKAGRFPSEMVKVLSADTARLTVPSLTTDLDGYFYCRLNDSTVGGSGTQPIAMTRVYVGNLPKMLTADDIVCNCDNDVNVTCAWCPAWQEGVTYFWSWTTQHSPTGGQCNGRQCQCTFGHQERAPVYEFNVTAINRFGGVNNRISVPACSRTGHNNSGSRMYPTNGALWRLACPVLLAFLLMGNLPATVR